MKLDRDHCALVLVDYQDRLWPALSMGESVLTEAVFLARVAQVLGVPVLGTEQNPSRLGPNAQAVRALCSHTLTKMHFDATADGLLEMLQSAGRPVNQVVVAGCEAHVCLMQTALGLLAAGLQVAVVPEACASRRPADRALGLQRLADAGAVMLSAEMLAFDWLRSCEDTHFREVLALIKARPV